MEESKYNVIGGGPDFYVPRHFAHIFVDGNGMVV